MSEIEDNILTPENPNVDSTVSASISSSDSSLPSETAESFWGKVKAFLLQEVEQDNFWFKKIVLEPAPIVDGKPRSFLFRNITLA